MKERISNELKQAMRERNKLRVGTLRLISTAFSTWEKSNDTKGELDEAVCVKILDTMVKQRAQSIAAYKEANRVELVELEELETEIIKEFLPSRMSKDEILAEAEKVKVQLGASTMKDMGKMMGTLKNKLGDKAEGRLISEAVKEVLTNQ